MCHSDLIELVENLHHWSSYQLPSIMLSRFFIRMPHRAQNVVPNLYTCSLSYHNTKFIEKDVSFGSRNIRPHKQSKFAKDEEEEEEDMEKIDKSEEQKAKLDLKRKDRADKKKETHKKQLEIQKKRDEKKAMKINHKKPLN